MLIATIIPVFWLIVAVLLARATIRRQRAGAVIGLVTWVTLVGPAMFTSTRPDLLFNPLDRFFLTEFGEPGVSEESLIPAVFPPEITRKQLEDELHRYGYSGTGGRYAKSGPLYFFACAPELQVSVDQSASGVSSATGFRQGWCL